jgi:hypothetical protein
MTAALDPLVLPGRTYGWRRWSDPIRESTLAIILGCTVTLIEAGGRNHMAPLHTFVRNAVLATSIMILARGLETMLSWAIEQSRMPLVFRTVIYALGAWLGLFLGLLVVASLYGAEDDDFRFHSFHFIYSITAAALVSVVVSFILHHNRKRNDRLRASIERLKEHEFAEKELEIARDVQRRLLPPEVVEAGGYHIEARTRAAHIVGGDFYDVVRLDDGSIAVLAADVSGKGIAASLIMASCKAVVPFLARSGDPARVLGALNEKLCGELQRREFVAMVYAHFHTDGSVQIANAGMPEPLLIGKDGTWRALSCDGDRFPLGVRPASNYCLSSHVLAEGDRLVLFSDGLPEALVDGEPLGYERVEKIAAEHRGAAAIIDAVSAISGLSIEDDVTAVVVSARA